ncbi:hypothetical protein [Priestia abyssalis]|uniref:hypothetical protein n=1 Tax=Priestia abyssalis TaxID=1221450 RepID=UPI000994A659|nr:hypothetical protein [Priestia abyssalis]
MKEQWVGKMEMLDLLDAVLGDLETVEQEISTKIDEVVSLHEHTQRESLRSIEHAISEIENVTLALQGQSDKREWRSHTGEAILRTV